MHLFFNTFMTNVFKLIHLKKQHLFSLFQVSNPWLCLETNLKEPDCVLMPMEPIFSIYRNNCNVNAIYCIIINEKMHERVSEHPV